MSLIEYEKLQVIETFKNLKFGDRVYSKKFGLGTVINFYNKEVVIAFSTHRQRFSEGERELRELPKNRLIKKNHRAKIEINGQEMTLREFKRKNKLDKQIAKLISK